MSTQEPESIKAAVRRRYGEIARQASSCCGTKQERSGEGRAAMLYTAEELASLPEGVTELSRGCGNPSALAQLKPEEVVLDLGSGGGIDCFLAAERVGPEGRVIGVDMTPEMVAQARANARELGHTQVEFRLGELEALPLADAQVDVIISNCVINLSPDKDAVFREAHRVLKPGGRLCVSDKVRLGELPPEVATDMESWSRCLAGAIPPQEYAAKLAAAGFVNIEVMVHPEADPQRPGIASAEIMAYKA